MEPRVSLLENKGNEDNLYKMCEERGSDNTEIEKRISLLDTEVKRLFWRVEATVEQSKLREVQSNIHLPLFESVETDIKRLHGRIDDVIELYNFTVERAKLHDASIGILTGLEKKNREKIHRFAEVQDETNSDLISNVKELWKFLGHPAYQSLRSDKSPGPNQVKTSKSISTAIVKHNYQAKQPDELSLVKGSRVKILEKSEDGWWRGQYENKIGWIPSNFIKEETDA